MKIVGLTGGIGSGKTTVAKLFSELGVPVYIADVEAKRLTNSSVVIRRKLTKLLGDEAYINGSLNRKFVADKIFTNEALLNAVNAIIHPEVAADFKKWALEQKTNYVIKEAAILFESGGYKQCDLVILVIAPKAVRIERIMMRDGATEDEIEQRMNNQWSDLKKKKFADIIIENIEMENTRRQVESIHNSLK